MCLSGFLQGAANCSDDIYEWRHERGHGDHGVPHLQRIESFARRDSSGRIRPDDGPTTTMIGEMRGPALLANDETGLADRRDGLVQIARTQIQTARGTFGIIRMANTP